MSAKSRFRLSLGARLNLEISQSVPALAIASGIVLAVAWIATRIASGSPYRVILALGISDLLPPVWLMDLLSVFAFFTVGAAAGLVLGFRSPVKDGEKYKSSMLFVLLAVLELCRYPTLFVREWVFLSVLESVLILCLSVCVTVGFFRVAKLSGVVFLLHDVWQIYLLLLHFAIFFTV